MSAWRESAACAGRPVSWFFPEGHNASAEYAKGLEVCRSCPVSIECRDEHERAQRELRRPLPGLWAGVIHGRRMQPSTPLPCIVCGTLVTEKRGGPTKYCSARCSHAAAMVRRGYDGPMNKVMSDRRSDATVLTGAMSTADPQGWCSSVPQPIRGRITAVKFDQEVG